MGEEPFASLGLALAAGLLIGLEREQSAPASTDSTAFLGGARTHPLFSMLGAILVLLARQLGPALFAIALAGLLAFLCVSYLWNVKRGEHGLTSEAAFLMSFLLGALAAADGVVEPLSRRVFVVAAVAVVSTLLLSSKPALHALVRRVSRDDVYALLKFLLVGVVVLPLLPDRDLGPLGAINPRSVGAMVALIAGMGLVGYVAVRVLGPERGLGVTGLAGGLVSSTAVTLAMADRARRDPVLSPTCALATIVASTVMVARIAAIVAAVNVDLLGRMAWPLGGMVAAGAVVSLWTFLRLRTAPPAPADLPLPNPVELWTALRFGLLFALILLGAKAAHAYFGARGAYVAGILAGATDVDAITLSMGRMAGRDVPLATAAITVFLGAASNTLVKATLSIALGGWDFGRRVLLAFLVMAGAGAVGLLLP